MRRAPIRRDGVTVAALTLALLALTDPAVVSAQEEAGEAVVPAGAVDEVYVAELSSAGLSVDAITVYLRTASGDVTPLRTIHGPATGLNNPIGVALDAVHGELVVGNSNGSITVYRRSAIGNTPPLRSITGDLFSGVAVDPVHAEIVATGASALKVYARTANGNATPLRTITGISTRLDGPTGVAVDLVHDEILVSSTNDNSIRVYPRTAIGNVAPLRTIAGTATGLNAPFGLALDLVHDEIVVADPFSASVRTFARTAAGNIAPLRTLTGLATDLTDPRGVALDLVHDELFVTNPTGASLVVHRRTASGNARPLRTIIGPNTALNGAQFPAVVTSPPLLAAVLPASRSIQVGTTATAFAAIVNAGPGPAQQCSVTPITSVPGTYVFQTTNASNQLVGKVNAPATIPAAGTQNFVFGFTPSAPFGPADVELGFACDGTNLAPLTSGVNTLLLVASATAVPDVIALAATVTNNGIVEIPSATGIGAFSVATSNVGVAATITASADTGGAVLPLALTVCQTDATGRCLALPSASVTLVVVAGATPTFSVFAQGNGAIPFDPAVNRVYLRFKDEQDVIRGSTSVAIRTQQ